MRVLENDPCSYCGGSGGEIDHIVPLAKGGTHSIDNLTGACKSCNSSKHITNLLLFMLRQAQNNTLLVSTNLVNLIQFSDRLDVEHLTALTQRALTAAKAAKTS